MTVFSGMPVVVTAALAGVSMPTFAALAGWRGWLALKHRQLQAVGEPASGPPLPNAGVRIEIADLKERIRKLEAIAAGVEP